VRDFLDSPFCGTKAVFSTYQSARVVGAALNPGEAFDLAVFDEAHKTAGREGRNFAFALEDTNLPIRKRLFLTATPRHYNPHQQDREGDAKLVFSMDRPDVYGPQAYRLSFAEAARRGIICGYKVIISVITSEMVTNELLNRGEVLVNGDAVRARQVANQISLRHAIEKYGSSRVFTFHGSVASAASFVAGGSEGIRTHLPEFEAFHVNGKMPTARREREMRNFRAATRAVMSNARCLTEGVDVPAVDMVAFLSPRRSRVDIVQATGRAMRRSPGKPTGYVLVPLYVEQAAGESIEQAVSRAEFDDVWDVLQSLQEQDEVLAEIIREMREEQGRTKGFNDYRLRAILEVIGPGLTVDRLRDVISAKCIGQLGELWEERFGQLRAFVDKIGHASVPKDWPDDPALGGWVIAQRAKHKRGALTSSRKERLESLPGWVWDYRANLWTVGYEHLVRFVQHHGHARVLQSYTEKGFHLGSWVGSQRQRYKDGTLEQVRAALLVCLPGWMWDTLETAWDVGILALRQFASREGHAAVPDGHTEGSCNLGSWVRMQRTAFKKGGLQRERIEQLEGFPGWIWDKRKWNWDQCFDLIVSFAKENGHSCVPQGYMSGEVNLGAWVVKQRARFSKGLLSAERTARLQGLPGWVWDKRVANWEEGFLHLLEFVKREGHSLVQTTHVESEFKLGSWVNQQRQSWKRNRAELSVFRVQRLERLPGWEWTPNNSAWEYGFAILKQFASREGNCHVPNTATEGGFRLGQWVRVQRTSHRAGKLSKEKVTMLEGLPDWTWEPFDRLWETGFSKLQEYVRRHHHALVPVAHIESDFPLGMWVSNQRGFHKRGKLAADRVARLEAMHGWLWKARDTKWEECFAILVSFVQREGNCAVPRRHVEKGFGLGQWVTNQRSFFRKGMLTEERRNRLRGLPGWSWALKEDSWVQAYGQLKAFAEREGHVLVPKTHVENGFPLGAWVVGQRQRIADGRISLDRRQELENLPGWVWDKRSYNWELGFSHLVEFVQREGHASVPTSHVENGFRLGQWVGNQRSFFRKGKMTEERCNRFHALPGWKWAR